MENNKKDRYESVSGKGYKSKKPVKKRKRNKPVFSNLKKYIGIVIGIVCIVLVAIYVNGTVYYTTHFYKETHINGIDVSKLTADEVENVLNKQSGVQGISGLAPDFREIEAASYGESERAKIAIDSFTYAIAGYIAKYAVAMRGIDYIVFTGGVGENQINIRKWICEQLEFMGVLIDTDANNVRSEEKLVSKPESKVKVFVIPTNEELMIAKETERLVK